MADPDFDKLNFYSGVNYMKRSDKSGQSTINASDVTVSHSLGYVPKFLHYCELDGDGFIWYGGERVFNGTDSTAYFPSPPPIVDAWMDETSLVMHPSNFSTARALYFLIYLDYGV